MRLAYRLAFVVTLCAGFNPFPALAAPLKMAVVESLAGPLGQTGNLYLTAVRYAVDRLNAAGGWNNEPIQVLVYDNQGTPAGASDKLKAAIADGAQVVIAGASSAVVGQIQEDVRKFNMRNPGKEILFLDVGTESNAFTGEKCHFHYFRFAPNVAMHFKVLIAGMKQEGVLGTRVFSINQNYSFGQDAEEAILDNASRSGYQVADKMLHDVNKIQDFSPYVARISEAKVDTVLTSSWGNDLLLLMKAANTTGLKARFGTILLNQPGSLSNAGGAALGSYVAETYNPEAYGKENEQFVNDFKVKTGRGPVFTQGQAAFGVLAFGEALKKVKPQAGQLNVNAVARAFETVTYASPIGELRMRAADHQMLLPLVLSVVAKDAKIKVDGTDMGFKPVKYISAGDAAPPVQASCKMQRP